MRKLTAKEGQDLVSIIQETAIRAGRTYDRQGAAFEAERQAEVAILEKAIELARPGLASVSNAIETAGAHGVKIAEGLYLLTDGTIGEPQAGWFEAMPYATALDRLSLPEILRPLADLFAKQVKGRESSTLAAEKRAAKLVALAELVDSF
jgi:hypothetical protein